MSADFSDATRTERHDLAREEAALLAAEGDLVEEAWDREPFDAETEHECPMCESPTEGTDPDLICAVCERTEADWDRL